jgi:hypothetical protein
MMMKFYWRMPEQGLPKEKHRAADRYVQWRVYKHWQVWVGFTLLLLWNFVVMRVVGALGYPPFVASVIGLGVGFFLCFHPVLIHYALPHYKEYLASIGHCQSCGYDLRGSPSGVCPECGNDAASYGTKPPS